MKFGFGRIDITSRIGVELCGYGPYLNRHSIAVRDRLRARAIAFERDGARAALIACDLIGVTKETVAEARRLIGAAGGLAPEEIMIHCTHTHSGPATGEYIGWGDMDQPYLELLPHRLARVAGMALDDLREGSLFHAAVPCEGIGVNREYDSFRVSLEEALDESWRPEKPERTDTVCHVARIDRPGAPGGFFCSFGCHPVIGGGSCRFIHGDYPGIAMNLLEHENPGATALFLQGAQGDVNSCVVGHSEVETLQVLDVVASRFARAVRQGLAAAAPAEDAPLAMKQMLVPFSRKDWSRADLCELLEEKTSVFAEPGRADGDKNVRMNAVYAVALRGLIARLDRGESLVPEVELHGLRIGPLALLGTPFEIMQAIKNDVAEEASAPVPLVLGLTNDSIGYAPDREVAARGGYAQDQVPIMCGELPFANLHEELVEALLELDAALA